MAILLNDTILSIEQRKTTKGKQYWLVKTLGGTSLTAWDQSLLHGLQQDKLANLYYEQQGQFKNLVAPPQQEVRETVERFIDRFGTTKLQEPTFPLEDKPKEYKEPAKKDEPFVAHLSEERIPLDILNYAAILTAPILNISSIKYNSEENKITTNQMFHIYDEWVAHIAALFLTTKRLLAQEDK